MGLRQLGAGAIPRNWAFVLFASGSFFLLADSVRAQSPPPAPPNKGTITGIIVNAKNGEPLDGAQIGTPPGGPALGTRADDSGRFTIKNVSPGTYDLVASQFGFKAKPAGPVIVAAGQTVDLGKIALEEEVVTELKTIEVTDKQKQLKAVESAKITTIDTQKMIKDRALTTTQEVIATQAGVTQLGDQLFVRGGRSGELKTMVDGLPVSDAFAGATDQGGTLNISTTSQSEMNLFTGGFDAEYGNAQSGIIEIVTREGEDHYEGNVRFMTDDFGAPDRTYFNYDNIAMGFGGPVPFAEKNLRFFLSGEGTFQDTYLKTAEQRRARKLYFNDTEIASFRDRQENAMSGQAKVTYLLPKSRKLSGEYLASRSENDWYHHAFSRVGYWSQEEEHWWFEKIDSTYTYYNGPEHLTERQSKADQMKLVFTNPVGPDAYFKVRGAVYRNRYKEDVADKSPGQYVSFNGNNDERDPENLFFAIRGDYPLFEERQSTQYTMRGDYQVRLGGPNAVDSSHEIKTGVTMDLFKFEKDHREFPSEEFPFGNQPNIYSENAVGGVLYLQDRLRYKKSMVMNAGLRFDFFDPGENAIRVANQRVLGLEKPTKGTSFLERWKAQISPRVGMSYPISDRDVLHFHYGRFFQLPELEFLYDYSNNPQVGNRTVGNPFLEPETTISYQFGVRRQLTNEVFLDTSVFFKDIFGLVGTVDLEAERETEQNQFASVIYVNQDYGSVRGFEISMEKRFSSYWQGGMTYTLSRATGSSSDVNQGATVADEGLDRQPIREVPLDWDRTHVVNTFLYFSDPGIWAINFDFAYGSGAPTTPRHLGQRTTRAEDINTIRLPATMTLNLRANKLYRLYGREFRLFLEGRNVLDRQNVRTELPAINPNPDNEYYREFYTEFGKLGGAYNLKDTIGASEDILVPLNDPRVWGEPRVFRFGISFEW